LCNAAAIIDSPAAASSGLTRGNNKTKASFNEDSSVFVSNLPQNVKDDELFQEFQKYGSVINCQVLRDHNSVSKQRGLVNFISREQAQNAITSTTDKTFGGVSGDQ